MAATRLRLRRPPQAATIAGLARRDGPLGWSVGCALTVALVVLGVGGVDRAIAQQSSAQPARPGAEIAPDVAERIKVHIPSVILAEPARETAMAIFITMRDQIPNNSLLRVRGLPASATLSEGHAIAPGTWAVPIAAVSRLRISVPADVSGKSEVTFLLVTVDGHVLAEAKTALVVGATARLIAPDLPPSPPSESATATAPMAPAPVGMAPSVASTESAARPESRPQVSSPVTSRSPESPATTGASTEATPNASDKAPPAQSPPATVAVNPLPPPTASSRVAAVAPEAPPVAVVAPTLPPALPPAAVAPPAPSVAAVPPAATPPAPKSTVAAITPSAITPPPAVKPPPLSAEARGRAMTFVTRGTSMLDDGNIAGARQFFERAAEVGLPEGAMALGTTYDPHELARLKVHGLRPDVATARRWYEKARDLGSAQALDHLARLGF